MRDGEIVTSIVAGDPNGLAAAYDNYATPLYRYCRSLVSDRSDAAGAVRDTFVIAASRLPGLRDPERLRAWLYAVARNECLRSVRDATRVPAPGVTDEAAAAGDGAEHAGLRLLFEEAARGLRPAEREAIELHLRQGLALAEVAAVLGMSRGRAHSLLSRAGGQLEAGLGVLLVDRGRDDCAELGDLLDGWDGRLTVPLRRRVHRHIERCAACTVRRAFELRPARLSGLPAAEALAAGAAQSFHAAAGTPASLKGHALALAAGRGPAAVAHQAAVLGRAGSFGRTGFPRALRHRGEKAGPRSSPRRLVPAAAVLTVLAAVLAVTLAGNTGQHDPAGGQPPGQGAQGAGQPATPALLPSATPAATSASAGQPTPSSASPGATRTASTRPTPPGTLSVSGASSGSRLQIPPGGTAISLAASGGPVRWSIMVSGDPGHHITASPASGTLADGATVQVLVTADQQVSGATLAISPGGTVYEMRIVGRRG